MGQTAPPSAGSLTTSVAADRNKSADGIKMLEITREKEVVWTYQNPDVSWVHSLQVLSTNGEPE